MFLTGCNKHPAKKPDPTKGVVTGIVLCADTGKPARFANVALSAAPKADEKNEQGDPLPATESTTTDLEGRFRIEAVEPGRYFAFATLDGYLDPSLGLDRDKLKSMSNDKEQHQYSIDEWKDHLTEVTIAVHRVSDVSIQIERGAEIDGTVTFDDGSPAIGMRFQLFRKSEKNGWSGVGFPLFDSWSLRAVTDSHGHFSITNLLAGEYAVCTLLPAEAEEASPRVCLGNTLRRKDAGTVKVKAGEIAAGVDIIIPLSGLHTVAGVVTALADGHPVGQGKARLLYADDREQARESAIAEDGSFSFEYVPEGKFIVQVAEAADGGEVAPGENKRHYADKELPVTVLGDVDDVAITLADKEKPGTKP
jgi:hypothetical protein